MISIVISIASLALAGIAVFVIIKLKDVEEPKEGNKNDP